MQRHIEKQAPSYLFFLSHNVTYFICCNFCLVSQFLDNFSLKDYFFKLILGGILATFKGLTEKILERSYKIGFSKPKNCNVCRFTELPIIL